MSKTKTQEQKGDVLHNHTTVTLGIMDRIRVLFGSKIRLSLEIETANEYVDVKETKSTVHVPKLIRIKRKQRGQEMSSINSESRQ